MTPDRPQESDPFDRPSEEDLSVRLDLIDVDADEDERAFVETPDEVLDERRDAPLGDPADRPGGRDRPR